jgi:hypothetical protein
VVEGPEGPEGPVITAVVIVVVGGGKYESFKYMRRISVFVATYNLSPSIARSDGPDIPFIYVDMIV